MPDSFLRSDFMGASLLGVVFEELFCGIGEDSLLAAEVRARPLIGSGVRGATRLLKCVLVVQCPDSRAASDVVLVRWQASPNVASSSFSKGGWRCWAENDR